MGIGGHEERFTELILMNPREGGTGYGVLISLISRAFAFDTGELLVLTPFIMQVGRGEGGEGGVGGEGRKEVTICSFIACLPWRSMCCWSRPLLNDWILEPLSFGGKPFRQVGFATPATPGLFSISRHSKRAFMRLTGAGFGELNSFR